MNSSGENSLPPVVASDPYELEEWAAADGWELQYFPLNPRTFQASFQTRHLPRSSIEQEHWNARVQLRGTIGSALVPIAIPIGGHGIFQGLPFHSGDIIFLKPGSELDLLAQSRTKLSTLHVPTQELESVAEKVGVENPTILVSDLAVVDFTSSFHQDFLKGMLEIDQIPASCLKVREELESRLLVNFWESLRKQRERKGRWGACLPARIRYVKRAQEFIEENLDQTIRLEDLVAASRIGTRTLQFYFLEYFQMSPLAYLRLRRLYRTRNILQMASPDTTTVTQVAMKYGFYHLGRFAISYRNMFGESPSTTLLSRPRRHTVSVPA